MPASSAASSRVLPSGIATVQPAEMILALYNRLPPANQAAAGAGAPAAVSCAASLCGGTKPRSCSALVSTKPLERAIAPAARIGERSSTKAGDSQPAGTGSRGTIEAKATRGKEEKKQKMGE